jgi:sodium-dependent dicarboxylate transporter 2/3/5
MKNIFIAILLALFFFTISLTSFDQSQSTLIAMVAFMVVLWSNEALPLGLVSLFPLILFPIFGIIDFNHVASNYSKPIIYLFIGGFLLAIAIEKTMLHKRLALLVLQLFPSSTRGIIYALSITSALGSTILTNTTTSILLVPVALYLTQQTVLKIRFVLAVAYGATIGGILTPIGTVPNLLYIGYIEEKAGISISFFEWVGFMFPIVFIMLLIVPFILSLGLKGYTVEAIETNNKKIDTDQLKIITIVVSLVLVLFINSPIKPFYNGLGLNEKMLMLGAGLLLFMPKIEVLKWSDIKKLPFEIIFLFGASFSIASAFTSTQLATAITEYFISFNITSIGLLIILIAFFVIFSTEVTSNTALITIALPIFWTFSTTIGINTSVILMLVTVGASFAFMLPISTPPNAIAISTGIIKVSFMAKIGFILNIIAIIVLSSTAYFWWL